jgi:ABC-2 type transport system permease protein
MTLKTSSNRGFTEWKHTYFLALKKARGMMALFALLQFMALPMVLMIWLTKQRDSGETKFEYDFNMILENCVPYLATPLVLIFTIILAVSLFSYMHQKRSVDLFHAIPVGRVPMLLGRYCAGLTAVFVPTLINFFIFMITGLSFGVPFTAAWETIVVYFLWLLLMSTAALTFSVFVAVCSGTTFDMVVSILGINAAYPLLVILGSVFASSLLPGLRVDPTNHLTILSAFAPFAAAFLPYRLNNVDYFSFDPLQANRQLFFLVWWILFTAALLVGSVQLYKRRKSECAESSFAFPLPKIVIRFMVTAVAGLGFGLILQSATNSAANFILGIISGSLAAHLVTEAVYSRGFSQLKKSFRYYLLFAAVFVASYGVLSTGAFGYDTRIPNASDVASVRIDLQNNYSYGNDYIYGKNGSRIASVIPTLKQPENIEKLVAFHQKHISKLRETSFPYLIQNMDLTNFTMEYTLKNGKTIKRTYILAYTDPQSGDAPEKDNPLVKEITDLEEYRKSSSILFYAEPDQIKSVDYTVYAEKDSITFAPNLDAKKELLEALQQDYLDGKVNNRKTQQEDGVSIYIDFKENLDPSSKLKSYLNGYAGKINLVGNRYQLTKEPGKTMELIHRLGWDK